MKISVITLHTVNNYGSILQTYATNVLLKRMGYDVEFVDYWRKSNTLDSRIENVLEHSALNTIKFLWSRNRYIKRMISLPIVILSKKRTHSTQSFLRKHVLFTHPYYSFKELIDDPPKADIYLTGSDQVWNSTWNEGIEKPYFLEYAPIGRRRIAFSASIGKEKLDDEERIEMRKLLSKYDSISMRETSGVEILRDLGIEASLVLDPTLMLTRKEWIKLAIPIKYTKPYIVVYQLNVNRKMDQYIQKIAKAKGWDIVRLSYGRADKHKGGKWVLMPKVEVFLGYILKSECIITDSFHMTSFALNLNKRFIVIPPNRFSTRIDSILNLTNTKQCLVHSYDDISIADVEIDFENVNRILNDQRAVSSKWLEDALS